MRRSARLHYVASRIHKWLALFLGVQLLIWFASGAIMSFLPINKVRGEHLVERNQIVPIPASAKLVDAEIVAALAKAPVASMTYRMLDERPVVEVKAEEGNLLFDGETGRPLPPVDGPMAIRIARSAWKSSEKPAARAYRVTEESNEYRGDMPTWRVNFQDKDATSIFVSADAGKIVAVRTGTWRFYDFFWGLHIMDWKNHENFNTLWLLAFAIGGLILGLAGTVLLAMRWPLRARNKLS